MSDANESEVSPFGSLRSAVGLGPKISAVMVSVLVVLGIVTALVVQGDQRAALRQQFIDHGVAVTRVLEVTASDYVSEGRHAALSERLQALADLKAVLYIIVTDQGGAPIASSFDGVPPMNLVQIINAGGQGKDVERVGQVVVTAVKVDTYDVLDVSSPLDFCYVHVGRDQVPIRGIANKSLVKVIVIFVLFVLIGAVLSVLAGQLLVRPLTQLMQVSKEVSSGNLHVRAEVNTRDEFATFGGSLNAMVDSLRSLVGGVRTATTRVSEAAADIVMSSKAQETGVAEQTASIDEVTHSMQSLTATANAIAGRSQELLSGLGQRMSDQLRNAQSAVDLAGRAMREISERNGSVTARVQELYEHSRAIISVIDIIENISDRLDLLALNAALEGARAGDVGKGFSLVATEMRRLAESVMSSTREVKETIAVIGEATRSSLAASRDSSEATKNGVAEMDSMVRSTAAMFTLIEQAVAAARQIFEITQQQLSSSTQVSSAMGEITAVSTSATGLAQEVTRAATQLSEIASLLESEVATFQLGAE